MLENENLIKLIFKKILKSRNSQKDNDYWKKILKVFDFIDTVLYYSEKVIDVNQRLIST